MDNKTSKVKKVFGIIGAVLFFASYLPFIFLIDAGINGTMSGLLGGNKLYGFEAMLNCFVWLCIVPVYPVCIIYQLIFGIAYIRKHRTLKFVTIGVVAALVMSILAAGLFASDKYRKQLEAARPEIEQYLTGRYGEGFITDDTEIRILYPDDDSYMVTTDVLPDGIEFAVNHSQESDDLINSFCAYNEGFMEGFEEYINEQYDLPDNMSLEIRIDAIEFGGYQNGDDFATLFDKVDYSVSGIDVNLQKVNDDIVEDLIYEVWEEQFPKFEDQFAYQTISMYIKENGELVYYVVYYCDSQTASVGLYRPTDRVSELEYERLELP